MSIQLKPGLWKTRDGRKAVVEYRTACPGAQYPWIGYIGKRVMSWSDGGMEFLHEKGGADLISPWTKPKLRQWKPEEVPVGAQIRNKSEGKFRALIVCVMDTGRIGFAYNEPDESGDTRLAASTPEDALHFREHSLDGGKTWLPCGVMEGEA